MHQSMSKKLEAYKTINKKISETATLALCRHLWYLREELIGLSFFSDNLSLESKQEMMKGLKQKSNITVLKQLEVMKEIHLKSIQDFVTSKSVMLFELLGIRGDLFIHSDPSSWNQNEKYMKGKDRVSGIKVVNDSAERGVALISQYNDILTKSDEQKQILLQVVQQHRKQFKTSKKFTLVAAVE